MFPFSEIVVLFTFRITPFFEPVANECFWFVVMVRHAGLFVSEIVVHFLIILYYQTVILYPNIHWITPYIQNPFSSFPSFLHLLLQFQLLSILVLHLFLKLLQIMLKTLLKTRLKWLETLNPGIPKLHLLNIPIIPTTY